MKYLNNYKIYETLNSRGSKSLSEDEFDTILKKNCKVWLEGVNNKLYRSQRYMVPYVYTDARGTKRTSIENINIHIDLMDSLDCWSEYPKYSQAIIGISDNPLINYGSGDSMVYEIIPFDGMKIAVCPDSNIWSSFSKDCGRFGEYIYSLDSFLSEMKLDDDIYFQQPNKPRHLNVLRLKEVLISIGNIHKYCESKSITHYVINDFLRKIRAFSQREHIDEITGEDVYNVIENEMFNPDARRFKLDTYDRDFSIKTDRQIWCSGPVLLVNKNLVAKLRENI